MQHYYKLTSCLLILKEIIQMGIHILGCPILRVIIIPTMATHELEVFLQ